MPKVIIGCPVRNRAWILPEYMQALSNINFKDVIYFFLENNSEDETFSILESFENENPDCVVYQLKDEGFAYWRRGEYSRDKYKYLANLRNQFLEDCMSSDADYILSIDSDIIA